MPLLVTFPNLTPSGVNEADHQSTANNIPKSHLDSGAFRPRETYTSSAGSEYYSANLGRGLAHAPGHVLIGTVGAVFFAVIESEKQLRIVFQRTERAGARLLNNGDHD